MDVKLIQKFAKFCKEKLNIKELPKILLTTSRDRIKTTAGYVRGKEIIIYTKGRHQVDICRSIAHELQHHKQWEDKEFNDTENIQDVGGKYEDDANAAAGQMIKKFAYSGNMKIYESRKIITEGKLQDAKRQFPNMSAKLVDYISSNDPSGNNKYLRWVLRQVRLKQALEPNFDVQRFVDEVLEKLTEYDKLLPYFNNQSLDADALTDQVLKNPKNIESYANVMLLDLAIKMIRSVYEEKQQDAKIVAKSDVIYDGSDYFVVHVNTADNLCYYNSQICNTVSDTQELFKIYSKKNYVFVIKSKSEQSIKFMVLLSKELNREQYITIYDSNNNQISMSDFKGYGNRLMDMVSMIEMWRESIKDVSPLTIRKSNPKLFVLTEFLHDEYLKHYKGNSAIFTNFNYNNGAVVENYYVGTKQDIGVEAHEMYEKQIKDKPNLLMRHPENLIKYLNLEKLNQQVQKYLGTDGILIDPDKVKEYYPIAPMKLNSDQIISNSDDLKELKQLTNDIENNNTEIKRITKKISGVNIDIKTLDTEINTLEKRIEVLSIRTKQIATNGDFITESIKTDRSGNYIGDGTYHSDFDVDDFDGKYPQVTSSVSKSETTETVYVTYRNNDNGKYIQVRFSNHENNAVKFGDQLDGNFATRDEILYKLGLKKAVFIPKKRIVLLSRQVPKKEIPNYEQAELTIQEMWKLPVGSDISAYKGKLAKGSNYLILADKIEEVDETTTDWLGQKVRLGKYVYTDLDTPLTNLIPEHMSRQLDVINLNARIGDYTSLLQKAKDNREELLKTKQDLDTKSQKYHTENDEMSDEYISLLNRVEETYNDKSNYVYSNTQIKDIKNKIYHEVLQNPVTWINKLKLTGTKLLEIVDIDEYTKTMTKQLIENIKNFGQYKYLTTITENNIEYHIFKTYAK